MWICLVCFGPLIFSFITGDSVANDADENHATKNCVPKRRPGRPRKHPRKVLSPAILAARARKDAHDIATHQKGWWLKLKKQQFHELESQAGRNPPTSTWKKFILKTPASKSRAQSVDMVEEPKAADAVPKRRPVGRPAKRRRKRAVGSLVARGLGKCAKTVKEVADLTPVEESVDKAVDLSLIADADGEAPTSSSGEKPLEVAQKSKPKKPRGGIARLKQKGARLSKVRKAKLTHERLSKVRAKAAVTDIVKTKRRRKRKELPRTDRMDTAGAASKHPAFSHSTKPPPKSHEESAPISGSVQTQVDGKEVVAKTKSELLDHVDIEQPGKCDS